jgi:zinc transport system ATP-binding protein
MADEQKTIVEMSHVYFAYNSMQVLEDIDFSILEKDFLGIIGPNGGGKTTILRMILGFIEPVRGVVTVFGKPPGEARGQVGYVSQIFTFDFDFPISVLEVVRMGRIGRRGFMKRYSREDTAAAERALNRVGLSDFGDRRIGSLSGGQIQRVLIARALAGEPKLLLLDESLSSIDSKWQNAFYELLKELNREMAIVLVSHDIGALSVHVEKVACLNRKLYYHGATKEGIEHLIDTYECPIELIAHGVPHRVLEDHE